MWMHTAPLVRNDLRRIEGGPPYCAVPVRRINPHAVAKTKAVKALADLQHELTFFIELEQLRGDGTEQWTAQSGARQHEDVSLGVNRYCGYLAQVHLCRVFEVIRHRFIRDLGRQLRP